MKPSGLSYIFFIVPLLAWHQLFKQTISKAKKIEYHIVVNLNNTVSNGSNIKGAITDCNSFVNIYYLNNINEICKCNDEVIKLKCLVAKVLDVVSFTDRYMEYLMGKFYTITTSSILNVIDLFVADNSPRVFYKIINPLSIDDGFINVTC